ncbi:septum formation initiator family protein [Candidatus Spongiihabitans sp.]|uniref:septum formation initiator family protein n=1 Tax=Candidatus Spongiihabitans sp. TaxID=3101308 RepID=UPI003C702064
MKPINLILLIIFLGAQYALWFGDKNVFDWYRLNQAAEQTRLENVELDQRNQRLVAEVIDLKEGGETVETIARSVLGLIKKGETFYQIIDNK